MESTVRTDGGRLFHTSGPQTEKARLPNWVRVFCIAVILVVSNYRISWTYSERGGKSLGTERSETAVLEDE